VRFSGKNDNYDLNKYFELQQVKGHFNKALLLV